MILVDTGPLVALFDAADRDHQGCAARLRTMRDALRTTVPVLTEAFHLLSPGSRAAQALMDFVAEGGLGLWHFDDAALSRAFELMHRYSDRPMDLADASLVAAAETLGAQKVFTLDRADFDVYRIRRGHRYVAFDVVTPRTGAGVS